MSKRVLTLLLSLSVATFSCGRGEDADAADDGDESAAVTSVESALTSELSDEVTQPVSVTPEGLATSSAARVPGRFTPAGCVVATTSGNTVTYVLTNCTGPYGLVTVSGTLLAVYTRAAGGQIQVVITGNNVKANNATINVNATVVASVANNVKRAEVTSDSTGVGPRGGTVDRKGRYTVTFDATAECVTVDGEWATTVLLRKATTVVTGYKRCKGSCPAAGGKIVHTTVAKKVITVEYDGTAVAKWSVEGGRTGTVKLACTP